MSATIIQTIPVGPRQLPLHFVDNGSPQRQWFFSALIANAWEPELLNLMARVLDNNWTWIDAGGWVGITPIYAQKLGAQVFAFEPDPVAFAELCENAQLNNIDPSLHYRNTAWSLYSGQTQLWSQQPGDSESSIFSQQFERGGQPVATQTIATVNTLDSRELLLAYRWHLNPHCIIKMDIEGGEFAVLPYLAHCGLIRASKCIWIVSLHEFNLAWPAARQPQVLQNLRQAVAMNLKAAFADLHCYTLALDLVPNFLAEPAAPHGQTLVFSAQDLTSLNCQPADITNTMSAWLDGAILSSLN